LGQLSVDDLYRRNDYQGFRRSRNRNGGLGAGARIGRAAQVFSALNEQSLR
jgi:hypothetical protein